MSLLAKVGRCDLHFFYEEKKTMRKLLRHDRERRILDAIRAKPRQSMVEIACTTKYARCTVHAVICELSMAGKIQKVTGRGRSPNYYVVL